MKYWGFFAAKIAAVSGVVYLLWLAVLRWMPEPEPFMFHQNNAPFGTDLGWTTVMLLLFLLAAGLFALAVIDQRYRCRTCLRRLRMPVESGSWPNSFLIGPPRMEYICPYGHGTLKLPELQITGKEKADWQEHGDYWDELISKK